MLFAIGVILTLSPVVYRAMEGAQTLKVIAVGGLVRATFDALKNQQSPRMVAQRRGRSVAEILAKPA